MHSEKRLITFALVMMVSILTFDYVARRTGLIAPAPPPKAVAKVDAPPKAEAAAAEAKADAAKPAAGEPEKAVEAKPETKVAAKAEVPLLKPWELVLGSAKDQKADQYHLEILLDQKGGAVASVLSSQYESEREPGQKKKSPLTLLKYDPLFPLSFSTTIRDPKALEQVDETDIVAPGETPLDAIVWDVVKDAQGKAVRTITAKRPGAPGTPAKTVEGQELTFRTESDGGLILTKTFRLFQGEDGFEVDLGFDNPTKTSNLIYRLLGPHGIPIEGEWYTSTFRDAIFEGIDGKQVTPIEAYEIVKKKTNQERFASQPLKLIGVENQYFAATVGPVPVPKTPDARWEAESRTVLVHEDLKNVSKSDIGVEILSKPITVGPGTPVKHTYRAFAGPKLVGALAPFGAEQLASYRKSNWIPAAPFFAKTVIAPLLNLMYDLTKTVARLFGWKNGNYGIAIILLTMSVRLAMFPLSRKQAISAKKMQDLQPLMKELQTKYGDDKEAQTRETWALYKRHGVNPISGCLPAFIQMPIFVGLWQALTNSVQLRNASFGYIQNLAAPDMLFRLPFDAYIPLVNIELGQYFNLLPFVVVSLMLVQTKLFSPPATTPEAKTQQDVMKFMMVFMAFMFYKVPSGLGIYFITSSSWQICERLLLPRLADKKKAVMLAEGDGTSNDVAKLGPGGSLAPEKPPGRFAQFWEKILAEAQKNPTYRNLAEERERSSNGGREPNRNSGGNANGNGNGNGNRDRNNRGKPRTKRGGR